MKRRFPLIWLCGVAAVLLTLALGISTAAASGGLVGDWQLTEGSGTQVADSSGAGNNGVLAGAAAWLSSPVPGLSFTGTSGRVRVPESPSLEPASTVTVSAWVNHRGSPGDYRYIVAKGATGCIAAAYGLYTGPHGGVEFYVSRNHGNVYDRSDDGGTGIWDGKWHLLVGTFDGTTLRLYVDGAQVGTGVSYPGDLQYAQPTNNDLYIGNYPGCEQHGFVGDIAAVKIWDVALSATQIKGMDGGASGTPAAPPSGGTPSGSGGSRSGGSGSGGSGSGGSGSASAGGGSKDRSGSKKANSGSAGGGSSSSGTGALSAGVPVISRLRVSHTARTGTAHKASRALKVTITYTISRRAQVRFKVLRIAAGVRSRGRCVAPPAHPGRHARTCRRLLTDARFTHTTRSGHVTLRMPAAPARRLTAGRFQLTATPSAGGRSGRPATVTFSVPGPTRR